MVTEVFGRASGACAVSTVYDTYWRPSVFLARSVLTQGPTILGTSLHSVSVFCIRISILQNAEYGYGIRIRSQSRKYGIRIRIRNTDQVPKLWVRILYPYSVSVFWGWVRFPYPYSIFVPVFWRWFRIPYPYFVSVHVPGILGLVPYSVSVFRIRILVWSGLSE
jgi:hypothetical protein